MARQVEALDCDQGKASVWKTIQLIQALEEVQGESGPQSIHPSIYPSIQLDLRPALIPWLR